MLQSVKSGISNTQPNAIQHMPSQNHPGGWGARDIMEGKEASPETDTNK